MLKSRNNKGFTLAEMLIVLAIIIVLAALITVMLNRRSTTKKMYDDYAKEIFVAAQNHLSMAEDLNFLGRKELGTAETTSGAYYFVFTGSAAADLENSKSLMNLMLPFGAVDETVRAGGCYIIRYDPGAASVLDVFYWEAGDSAPFPLDYDEGDYAQLLSDHSRATLRRYRGVNPADKRSVVGWYGSNADLIIGPKLERPDLFVLNSDRLVVYITDRNVGLADSGAGNYRLKLLVTGVKGGAKEFNLLSDSDDRISKDPSDPLTYVVVLDDITSSTLHFSSVGGDLIPGDTLQVQAVAFMSDQLTNVAYSRTANCNSLSGDETSGARAEIANFRHLENLDPRVSTVGAATPSGGSVTITEAFQTVDLSWHVFFNNTVSKTITYGSYYSSATGENEFLPVTPEGALDYDGARHTISGVKVGDIDNSSNSTAPAGLFGSLSGGSVKDLRLDDFNVTAGANTGALAGQTDGTDVTNVLATGSKPLTGGADVGGLIGSVTGGTILKSASTLTVTGGTSSGGLIGSLTGGTVKGCYAAGHTTAGKYSAAASDVTGATAGGLVGTITSGAVQYSYSTCSVSGSSVAGGFVGAPGGTVTKCYATGLVSGPVRGAFAGSSAGAFSGCHYYELVNEIFDKEKKAHVYLAPVPADGEDFSVIDYSKTGIAYSYPEDEDDAGAEITPLDAQYAASDTFYAGFSTLSNAIPNDGSLRVLYAGKYPLASVADLGCSGVDGDDFVATHYGDWPAPETVVVQ